MANTETLNHISALIKIGNFTTAENLIIDIIKINGHSVIQKNTEFLKLFRTIAINDTRGREFLLKLISDASTLSTTIILILNDKNTLAVMIKYIDFYFAKLSVDHLSEFISLYNKIEKSTGGSDLISLNLAIAYLLDGSYRDAVERFLQLAKTYPDAHEIKVNLTTAVNNLLSQTYSSDVREPLLYLLKQKGFIRPRAIIPKVLEKSESLLTELTTITASNLDEKSKLSEVTDILIEEKLLIELIRLAPLPSLAWEQLLLEIRYMILKTATTDLDCINSDILSAVASHFLLTNFLHPMSPEERTLLDGINRTKTKISATQKARLAAISICFGLTTDSADLVTAKEIGFNRLIKLVTDLTIGREIKLSEVTLYTDNVSTKVEQQYDTYPYPSWVDLKLDYPRRTIAEHLTLLKLSVANKNSINVIDPKILVAGCGTGQHAIEVANRYANSKVTAIDLSKKNLSYAVVKAAEFNSDNIEFIKMNILNVSQLSEKYDLIECVGVLHHMADPDKGLSNLAEVLIPGGVMRLGLYSSIARRPILNFRRNYENQVDICAARKNLIESKHHLLPFLIHSADFYSRNGIKDLLFHEQECELDLLKVIRLLKKNDLKFIGFEFNNSQTLKKFQNMHKNDADILDLSLWDIFERQNPNTFRGMYQFWCQKITK